MTCIVNEQTKKELKEKISLGKLVVIEDPSIINPKVFYATDIKEGERIVVTNHPKRSFFATITKKNGIVEVK